MTIDGTAMRDALPQLVVYRDLRRRLTVIVSEDQYRWLSEIEQALACVTWGELRRTAPPDVFLEILDFAGYGDLADELFTTLSGRGVAGWPTKVLEWQHRTGERLPLDSTPFRSDRLEPVLGGAYPPDPWILMADVVPRRLLHFYEREWRQTTELGIDDRDIVSSLLTELGRAGSLMRHARDPHDRLHQVRAAS